MDALVSNSQFWAGCVSGSKFRAGRLWFPKWGIGVGMREYPSLGSGERVAVVF